MGSGDEVIVMVGKKGKEKGNEARLGLGSSAALRTWAAAPFSHWTSIWSQT